MIRFMNEIRIELLKPENFQSLWKALDLVARERKYLIYLEAPPYESSVAFYETMMGKQGIMLNALDGERVVGWCDVRRVDAEISKHCGILGMGLVDGYRGRGLGERLITQTLDAIRKSNLGIERVELTVWGSNARAIGLYEKVGFAHEGRKVGARKIDGATDDVMLMAKFL
jgi:ribosomal protein S18 acetylase RimI-like enzyme